MENLYSFLYGLLVAVIISILEKAISALASAYFNKNSYSINGFWISNYNSAFDPTIRANDIVWIYYYRKKIYIVYHQYYNKIYRHYVFKGQGYIANNGRLAIAYNFNNSKSYQNGVMLLTPIDIKSTKKGYSGKFYEFDARNGTKRGEKIKGSELKIYDIDYIMIPYSMSLIQKIKFFLNKDNFTPDRINKEFEINYYEQL